MISLSEIVVAGLLEAFVILLVALVIVLVLNHRLHKKRGSLATQLTQLKETTVFLLDKVNEYSAQTYSFFLKKAVNDAKHETERLMDTTILDFSIASSEAEKASLIRYLLLEAELAAENETDEAKKAELRASKVTAILQDFEAARTTGQGHATSFGSLNEADFKSKWGHLCDAAVEFIATRTSAKAEDFIDIIRVLNADLELDEIIIPTKTEPDQGSDIEHVRSESDRNKEIIAKLLAERNAAEAEVNVRVSELERLQRFLKESEWCMSQMDEDLQAAKTENTRLREANDLLGKSSDMNQLVQKYTQESSEMLICIETLEQENSDLKQQLGLQ